MAKEKPMLPGEHNTPTAVASPLTAQVKKHWVGGVRGGGDLATALTPRVWINNCF